MFSFIKSLFNQNTEVSKQPPENVSEPVLSFVQTFLKNPKRFRVVEKEWRRECLGEYYELVDTQNSKKFEFSRNPFSNNWSINDWGLGFTLTDEEKDYLLSTIGKYYEDRNVRYKSLKETRARKKLYNQYKC
jgi:hypothetical protein